MITPKRGTIAEAEESLASPKNIDVSKLDPHPDNPRTFIDNAELEALGASIANLEQLQPIHVQPHGKGRYRILTGERRWRAAKLVGRKTIAAFIRNVSPEQAAEIIAEDNLQHVALNPIDKARAYALLVKAKADGGAGMTQMALAKRLKLSQPNIANTLRLLKLPREWQERIAKGELTYGQARALASYADNPKILKAVEEGRQQDPAAYSGGDAFLSKLATIAATMEGSPDRQPIESAAAAVIEEKPIEAPALLPLTRRATPVNHAEPTGESILSTVLSLICELTDLDLLDRIDEFVAQRRSELRGQREKPEIGARAKRKPK